MRRGEGWGETTKENQYKSKRNKKKSLKVSGSNTTEKKNQINS